MLTYEKIFLRRDCEFCATQRAFATVTYQDSIGGSSSPLKSPVAAVSDAVTFVCAECYKLYIHGQMEHKIYRYFEDVV